MNETSKNYNCIKCGTKNSVMVKDFVYRIKNKSDWELMDKQVRQLLTLGKPLLLNFTSDGLKVGVQVSEKIQESNKDV